MIESIIGFSVLIALILLRLPLAFAMGVIGFVGFWYINDYNWSAAMSMAARRIIDTGGDYGLSVIPLFILMGNFVTKAGISNELYKACNAFVGHRRGGLSMSTILACGGFLQFVAQALRPRQPCQKSPCHRCVNTVTLTGWLLLLSRRGAR